MQRIRRVGGSDSRARAEQKPDWDKHHPANHAKQKPAFSQQSNAGNIADHPVESIYPAQHKRTDAGGKR
jgi:hypothetical protein